MRRSDREAIRSVFARMSPESVRHRFFVAKRELLASDLTWLDELGKSAMALAGVVRRRGREEVLGIARYARTSADSAEIAFDIADAHHGRGLGTLLLEQLAEIARGQGITKFHAFVESDNAQMLDVFERSGMRAQQTLDSAVYSIAMPTAETDDLARLATERERLATAASLRPIFAPRSVAVIGASRTPGGIGRAILDTLIRDGYRGAIYPVHPSAPELAGRPCARSVLDIQAPIDLAVIAVPAASVERVVADCAAAGVRAVVIISAGFAEVGGVGKETEARLRETARAAGMRLVGPNCMGVLSTAPDIRLDATFSPVYPPAGTISFATQSGALGLALLDHARAMDLGIADFISLGNRADVSPNDAIAYWRDDPHTRVIALYLESFGNPRAFARLAPDVAREKPIIAVKSGRSAAGTRAASSHSAALASIDVGIDALFAQTGVIRVDTLEQLFDLSALLSTQPAPLGNRIGVVTNAGGPGILLADACEAHGLVLPKLAETTLAQLRSFLPAQAGLANPIDMIASAPPEHFERTLAAVGNDPNVDAVVAIYIPPLVTNPEDVAAAIARGAGEIPRTKPVATVFMSSKGTPPALAQGPRGKLPSYSFPENAALSLSLAARYERWRQRPRGEHLRLTPAQEQAVREWIRAARTTDGWIDFSSVCALLGAVGIRVAYHRRCDADPDAAGACARELGFPVVLKAVAPGLIHKTDAGGVALGLASEAEVFAAATAMRARIPTLTGFVVQREVPLGVETLVGMTLDPSLGPLLVAGIGGVAVELYKDVAFRVTPVTDRDAAEMLDELRGKALFDGFRGSPAVDRRALLDVIQRVAALVEVAPEITELDLNPLIVLRTGAVAVDARIRLRREGQP
ncbi:MAG: GNAT family N-acetyltransferase [Deltaproteobacteria bacterium]|nr:GNAT family N-acetyltransferase [Deltaproteobacteria bacterium]